MSSKVYNQCRIRVQCKHIREGTYLRVYYLEKFNYGILNGILDY
jgi:hypothetical protein